MWKEPFSFREGSAIVAGLIVVGLMLQLSMGPLDWDIFMSPANIITLIVFIALLVLVYALHRKYYFVKFMMTGKAAVPAIVGACLLTLIMGLTRQVGSTEDSADPIGLTKMLSFWPFILVYVWMTAIVGLVGIKQIANLSLKRLSAALSHVGLFIVLTCGTLGSADMQRLKMFCETGKPEWRALDAYNNVHELPIAIQLEKFTIDEYPPKLMIIDASGRPLPYDKPAVMTVDSKTKSETLLGWRITIEKNIANALPSALAKMYGSMDRGMASHIRMDSVGLSLNRGYMEADVTGSECALLVKAERVSSAENYNHKVKNGWVTCGSYSFPYQGLSLDKNHTLVMGQREPKSYLSKVDIFTQDGKNIQTDITVNHPYTINGWKVYQLSYNEQMGKWSTLSVFELVKDPWLPIVYFGILLLALGAVGLLFNGKGNRDDVVSELKPGNV